MKWFVIKENEHIGPYRQEFIKKFYAQGKLNKASLLWKEGMSGPRSYKALFIDEKSSEVDEELPPPLPPEVVSQKEKEISEEVSVPPLELPRAKNETVSVPKASKEPIRSRESEIDVPETPSGTEKNKSGNIERRSSRGLKLVLVLLVILIGAAAGYYYLVKNESKGFARPSKMSVRDYKRLRKGLAYEKITAAISKDKTTIFVSVGSKLEGPIRLKLKSFYNQVLTVDPVKATATAVLKDHLVEFKEFDFENGQRLAEGWYEFELQSLGELEAPFSLFGSNNSKTLNFRTKVLLTTKSVPAFKKALANFHEKNSESSRQFWEELIQKYQTMKVMAQKIEKDMEAVFDSDSARWGQSIDSFESAYTNNHGRFFTAFVIQNEKAYEDLKKQDFQDNIEVIANYTRLTKLAKSVGLETMNALDVLRQVKDPTNGEARVEAEQKIKELYGNIYETISESVKELESKI